MRGGRRERDISGFPGKARLTDPAQFRQFDGWRDSCTFVSRLMVQVGVEPRKRRGRWDCAFACPTLPLLPRQAPNPCHVSSQQRMKADWSQHVLREVSHEKEPIFQSEPVGLALHRAAGRFQKPRRIAFEALESRCLLSVGLGSIANVTLPAGTTMFVPLAGSDPGQTLNFAVTASDYSKLTPVIMPQTNKTLELNVNINGIDRDDGLSVVRQSGAGHYRLDRESGELADSTTACRSTATEWTAAAIPSSSKAATTRPPAPSRPISRRWPRSSIRTSNSPRPAFWRWRGLGPEHQFDGVLRHGGGCPVPRLQLHDLRLSDGGDECDPGDRGHGGRKLHPGPQRTWLPANSR